MTPYESLANAVVKQAVMDYKANYKKKPKLVIKATRLKQLYEKEEDTDKKEKAKKRYEKALEAIDKVDIDQQSIKNFFLSEWYMLLTNMDGEKVLRHLERTVG